MRMSTDGFMTVERPLGSLAEHPDSLTTSCGIARLEIAADVAVADSGIATVRANYSNPPIRHVRPPNLAKQAKANTILFTAVRKITRCIFRSMNSNRVNKVEGYERVCYLVSYHKTQTQAVILANSSFILRVAHSPHHGSAEQAAVIFIAADVYPIRNTHQT